MVTIPSSMSSYVEVVRSLDWQTHAQRYRYARMRLEDLDEVMAIERRVYPDPWSRWVFVHEIVNNPLAHLFVLRTRQLPSRIHGYVSMRIHDVDAHLTNLAVHPEKMGQKLGKFILAFAMDYAARKGARCMWLEVRKSNERAKRLYQQFGFQFIRELPHYYPNGEDALVMMRTIRPLLDEILMIKK